MKKEVQPKQKTRKEKKPNSFFYLLRYVGKYKKYAILTPFLVAIEAVLEVLIPNYMSLLIKKGIGEYSGANNDVFIPGQYKNVLIYGAIMIGMGLIALVAGALAAATATKAAQGFAKNLRKAEFESIQDYSFANADKFQTSSLITRLTTDVTNTSAAFQMTIRLMFRAPIMLIFATTMSYIINPNLAWIYIIAIPVLFISMTLIMKFAFPSFSKMLKKFDSMNSSVQEDLIGIRVVKSFVREETETDKFMKASNDVRQMQIKAEKLLILTNPIMQFLMYGCMVVIAFVGGVNIINGTNGMQYSDLTAFLSYTTQILMSLMMISMFMVNVVLAQASMDRICEVVREVPDIKNNLQLPDIPLKDGSIEFKNVNFSYSKDLNNCVLNDVNLSIKSGETIGIIGGTGSSKSTFVSLIPRLYDVTDGELIVGQNNVKDYRLKTLRDQVSVVLQKNVLFSGTIKDNLRWGNATATDEQIIDACKKAQAHDFIMSFPNGYDTDLGQGGVNVSGGQKQRLCIARALLKNPKILILDDSTSAVDTATDSKIRKAFRDSLGDVTTIIIAQRITSVQDADKIIVLDSGKVQDFGSHEELLKKSPIYQEVYNSQMKGAE